MERERNQLSPMLQVTVALLNTAIQLTILLSFHNEILGGTLCRSTCLALTCVASMAIFTFLLVLIDIIAFHMITLHSMVAVVQLSSCACLVFIHYRGKYPYTAAVINFIITSIGTIMYIDSCY